VVVKVVLVRTDDPVLLEQARHTWRELQQARRAHPQQSRQDPESNMEATAVEPVTRGVTAKELVALLEQSWAKLPAEPVPVLSKVCEYVLLYMCIGHIINDICISAGIPFMSSLPCAVTL
jgi:hypothetical protein